MSSSHFIHSFSPGTPPPHTHTGEERQVSVMEALNAHIKKQAKALQELDDALKQEHYLRIAVEEQLAMETNARMKAEEALSKLEEIFSTAARDDDEAATGWEMVRDGNDDIDNNDPMERAKADHEEEEQP